MDAEAHRTVCCGLDSCRETGADAGGAVHEPAEQRLRRVAEVEKMRRDRRDGLEVGREARRRLAVAM